MDLRALSDFVLVAVQGGFSQASRASGQSKATLSRRVAELEDELGFRLFDRDTRALRLTDEGEALFARTRGPLAEITEAEIALTKDGDRPHGRLRISAPTLFSQIALGAIAAAYLKTHPSVRLEIVAEDRIASAVEDGFDILIRVNPPPTDALVGRCLFRANLQVVAHPSLVGGSAARGPLPFVAFAGRPEAPRRPLDGVVLEAEPILEVSSLLTLRQAVLGGAGAGVLPGFLVAGAVAAGRLLVLAEIPGSAVEVWVLHPSRRLNSRKVTSFLQHLSATFPDGVWPDGLGESV